MNVLIKKHCTKEWQAFVKSHSEIRTFEKNEIIFNNGDDVLGLFLVNAGKVKLVKEAQANIRVIRLATKGDIVGHRGLGAPWKYSISAIALEESNLLFIPIDIFNQTVKANPDFALFMIMFFAEELRDSESLALSSLVKNLVGSALVKNHSAFGLLKNSTELSYSLSRKDLASMAGTTYESVVRSLGELQKDGIIKLEGKAIHIVSIERLKALSN